MKTARNFLAGIVCVINVPMLLGCDTDTSVDDPRVITLRERFTLSSEPAGATSISDAVKALKDGESILVRGQIPVGDVEPWNKGKARFLMSEAVHEGNATGQHGGPGHDPETCPFCKRRNEAKRKLALVEFLDADDNVLEIDARELFGVEEGQVVVVRGNGKIGELGVLVISANAIHICSKG